MIILLPSAEGRFTDQFIDIMETKYYPDTAKAITWSPDGKYFAAGFDVGKIRVFYSSNASERIYVAANSGLNDLEWSPDGRWLASAHGDKMVKLWDASTLAVAIEMSGHTDVVSSVSWNPESTRIFSGSRNGELIIWDISTGTELQQLPGSRGWAWSVDWSPDGKKLASGGNDQNVVIWDSNDFTEITNLPVEGVIQMCWSPDSKKLATISNNTMKIWDTESGNEVKTLSRPSIWRVDWSPDGDYVAAGGFSDVVTVWNTANWSVVANLSAKNGNTYSLSWSPNSSYLASGSQTVMIYGPGEVLLTIGNISLDRSTIVVEESLTVNVTFINTGSLDAIGSEVVLLDGIVPVCSTFIDVPRRTLHTTEMVWTTNLSTRIGNHSLRVDLGIIEKSIDIQVVGKPLLVMEALLADKRTVFTDGTVSLTATVLNNGTANASEANIRIYEGNGLLGVINASIDIGQRFNTVFTWQVGENTAPGVHTLRATVGHSELAVNVTVVNLGTVYIRELRTDRDSILLGESVNLTGAVVNRGSWDLFDIELKLYDTGVLLTICRMDIRNSGTNITVFHWPTNDSTSPGNHTFTMTLGSGSKNASVLVVEIPAVMVLSVSASTGKVQPNERLKITALVSNIGKKAYSPAVRFVFNDQRIGEQVVTIPTGENRTVSFTWRIPENADIGDYSVRVEAGNSNRSCQIKVTKATPSTGFIPSTGIPAMICVLGLSVINVCLRRRRCR